MKGQIIIPSLDRDCTCLGVPEWSKLFNHEWLYLARTAASEIHMGIALVRFLLFLLIAGA